MKKEHVKPLKAKVSSNKSFEDDFISFLEKSEYEDNYDDYPDYDYYDDGSS